MLCTFIVFHFGYVALVLDLICPRTFFIVWQRMGKLLVLYINACNIVLMLLHINVLVKFIKLRIQQGFKSYVESWALRFM